jgi:hypothetical protein
MSIRSTGILRFSYFLDGIGLRGIEGIPFVRVALVLYVQYGLFPVAAVVHVCLLTSAILI